MLISLISAKGSPGVTTSTLALAAAWPRTAIVVDADPFGGDVRAGLGRGVWPPDAELRELVLDARHGSVEEALWRRVHRTGEHCPPVLAGLGSVGQAGAVPWNRIAPALRRLTDADAVADCGRFLQTDGVLPLLQGGDAVVLVTGSSLPAVRSAARLSPVLRRLLDDVAQLWLLVVRPDQPYSAVEIADGCRIPLLGELPDDPRTASVWSDGSPPRRGLGRSALQREAHRIASTLCAGTAAGRAS